MSKESFVQEQFRVFKAKNQLYGNSFNESLDKWGDIAYAVRAEDKLKRISQLTSGKDLTNALEVVSDESLQDTVKDLFNYTAMMDAYALNKNVYDSMRNMVNNYNNLEIYLFEGYGRRFDYLLDRDNPKDRDLFNRILMILNTLIQ